MQALTVNMRGVMLGPILALCLNWVEAALAQGFSGLPPCAETAALQELQSSGCPSFNITCICLATQWINSLEPVFAAACPPPAVTSALNFASRLCEDVATVTPHFSSPTAAVSTFTTTVNGPQSAWFTSSSPITTTASVTAAPMPTGTSSWATSSWTTTTISTTSVAVQATSATASMNGTALATYTTMVTPTLLPANFTGGGSSDHFNSGAISFVVGIHMMLHIACN